jgi:type IV secretory pathway VirJ component
MFGALLLLIAAASGCRDSITVTPTAAGRMGTVRLFRPRQPSSGFVFLFSDSSGWNDGLESAARSLAARDAVVFGVDLAAYRRGLAASDDGCHYVIAEMEDASERLQRDLGFPRYRSPILAGIGEGATLAYAGLAQSPAATIGGALSIDPVPVLHTTVPLCPGAVSSPAPGGGFSYAASSSLPGWWRVEAPAPAAAWLQAMMGAVAEPLLPSDSRPAAERLAAALLPLLAVEQTNAPDDIADLPLVEIEAEQPGQLMAVIYSGDGGWRDLDKDIGGELARQGVPTVGVDSLRYFWRERSPEEMANDLDTIIRHYTTEWRTPRVILVGYSFGAGTLPFAVNRLPGATREHVVLVSLLGLESRAAFEIELTAWLGAAPSTDAPPTLPEVLRLDPRRLQCFYGEEEEDTLCRDPQLAAAEVIRTKGGHHFDEDYVALAQRILDGARRRLAPAPL